MKLPYNRRLVPQLDPEVEAQSKASGDVKTYRLSAEELEQVRKEPVKPWRDTNGQKMKRPIMNRKVRT